MIKIKHQISYDLIFFPIKNAVYAQHVHMSVMIRNLACQRDSLSRVWHGIVQLQCNSCVCLSDALLSHPFIHVTL